MWVSDTQNEDKKACTACFMNMGVIFFQSMVACL